MDDQRHLARVEDTARVQRQVLMRGDPRATAVFLIGFVLIWGVMYASGAIAGSAIWLGVVGLLVTLATAAAWEIGVFSTNPRQVLADLGFGRPKRAGMIAAAIVSAVIAAFYIGYSAFVSPLALRPEWPWMLIGVFAYHGLAEELAWRGYAFRRIREGRSFRSAVLWSVPLIAATHIPILISAGPMIGLVSMVIAAVTCLPFAYLWERGGRTIWAPALVHAAIDLFKVVQPPTGEAGMTFSLALAAVSIGVPLLVFADRLFRPRVPAQQVVAST